MTRRFFKNLPAHINLLNTEIILNYNHSLVIFHSVLSLFYTLCIIYTHRLYILYIH